MNSGYRSVWHSVSIETQQHAPVVPLPGVSPVNKHKIVTSLLRCSAAFSVSDDNKQFFFLLHQQPHLHRPTNSSLPASGTCPLCKVTTFVSWLLCPSLSPHSCSPPPCLLPSSLSISSLSLSLFPHWSTSLPIGPVFWQFSLQKSPWFFSPSARQDDLS